MTSEAQASQERSFARLWMNYTDMKARASAAEERIAAALRELGEPTPDYPAPVANAVAILRGRALTSQVQGE